MANVAGSQIVGSGLRGLRIIFPPVRWMVTVCLFCYRGEVTLDGGKYFKPRKKRAHCLYYTPDGERWYLRASMPKTKDSNPIETPYWESFRHGKNGDILLDFKWGARNARTNNFHRVCRLNPGQVMQGGTPIENVDPRHLWRTVGAQSGNP